MEQTILLVDDEERFLTTTKKLIEKRGYQVEIASSGQEAIEKIEKLSIQLVILDVKMPIMNGITVLKKIKRDFPSIEIIMLTGHATIESAVEGVKLGATDYLTKPANIDDMVEAIENTLEKKKFIYSKSDHRISSFKKLKIQIISGISIFFWFFLGLLFLIGYSWQDITRLIVIENRSSNPLFYFFYDHRDLLPLLFIVLILIVPIASWLVAGFLIHPVQIMSQKKEELQFQLFHASKLASIGELATGVAHEINNPLAIIVAHCGIIADLLNPDFSHEPNPQKILEEVDTICQSAFRASRITRQLVDFGLKKELKLIPCNINQILDDILDGFKAYDSENERIKIIRNYATEALLIPLEIDLIKQVFINLLNNAFEAIIDIGVITISTVRKNDYFDITIEDTGVGITPSQQKNIFKPFYSTKKVGTGTGLSLSISLNIVESQGGTIDVQSTEGEGSRFIVSFPV